MKRILLLLSVVAALALMAVLFGNQAGMAVAQEPTGTLEIPFLQLWESSPHADATAEAFTHWNEDSPPEIPTSCAKCHSTPGYMDFLGADGTTAGEVNNPAPTGTVITCIACHNDAARALTSVVMPSGVDITGLGAEARCMECHQGRASTVQVTDAISNANVSTEDTVSADLSFINIHYFAAAATKYGTVAEGGYQYEGMSYDANFAHVAGYDTCVTCHNMHSLEVRLDACQTCHSGVTTADDLKNIRKQGSLVDYNGNGDLEEGIFYEVQGLQEKLYQAIQAYGKEVTGTPIAYDAASHPYFFIDTNDNGQVDPDEATSDNAYNAWTPRLLKAAYNYQVSVKDPGGFAHNAKYVIELLYDSTEDLNTQLSTPVDMSAAHRIDPGHFAGSTEPFRHWDEEGEVPGTCSKCHSGMGLPITLENPSGFLPGNSIPQPPANGLLCATCHDNVITFTRYAINQVEFPSGAELSFGEGVDANVCLECHQGRESTVSVNQQVDDIDPDMVTDTLRFLNVHYFAAGATLFGGEAAGAYQYAGKEYLGQNMHVPGFNTCDGCHNTHELTVKLEQCSTCHTGVQSLEDLKGIRMSTTDYDGDQDTNEGMAEEVSAFRDALLAAMQDYAENVAGTPIVYDPNSYPYYFIDTNGNGQADADETTVPNQYNAWTPRLLKAAYNLQYVTKDPGAFAHNGKYIIQVLYDSLEDLSAEVTVDMSNMTRP
jgi:hypothetical protein